jgi:hypothetical protein
MDLYTLLQLQRTFPSAKSNSNSNVCEKEQFCGRDTNTFCCIVSVLHSQLRKVKSTLQHPYNRMSSYKTKFMPQDIKYMDVCALEEL